MKRLLISLLMIGIGIMAGKVTADLAEYAHARHEASERKRRYAERRANLQPHYL